MGLFYSQVPIHQETFEGLLCRLLTMVNGNIEDRLLIRRQQPGGGEITRRLGEPAP